jgi:hypothetical protein
MFFVTDQIAPAYNYNGSPRTEGRDNSGETWHQSADSSNISHRRDEAGIEFSARSPQYI